MSEFLVTGGNGVLGQQVARRLADRGHGVRVMSRGTKPFGWERTSPQGATWHRADLESGEGLVPAVTGVDTIVHTASSPFGKTQAVDVEGTAQLLRAAESAAVKHIVYISIVGIDRIPFAYYRGKLAAEAVIQSGGVPWTILRTTQWHDFLDRLLNGIRWSPIWFLPPDFRLQLLDSAEVADAMTEAALAPPAGRLTDMGGPQILTSGEVSRTWLEAQGLRRRIFPLPLWGKVADGFRRGLNTCPDHRQGRVTWTEWLAKRYPQRAAIG